MNKIDITETVKNMFEIIKSSKPGLLSFNFVNSSEVALSVIQTVLNDRGYTSFIVLDGAKNQATQHANDDDETKNTKQKHSSKRVKSDEQETSEKVILYRMYVNVPNRFLIDKKTKG